VKLSAPQRQLLQVVALRKQRLDDDRRAAEYAVRAEVADRTASARAEYERAVVEANRAGVPNAQLALAVGTTNPRPIREILNRAASSRRSIPSNRYSRGGPDLLHVQLDGDNLANASKATGWTVAEAIAVGVDRATFRVTDVPTLVAVTPSFVVEAGRLHPVISFFRSSGAAEALTWWVES
jgi:hypothetical protein